MESVRTKRFRYLYSYDQFSNYINEILNSSIWKKEHGQYFEVSICIILEGDQWSRLLGGCKPNERPLPPPPPHCDFSLCEAISCTYPPLLSPPPPTPLYTHAPFPSCEFFYSAKLFPHSGHIQSAIYLLLATSILR